jgi:hypothetical protein
MRHIAGFSLLETSVILIGGIIDSAGFPRNRVQEGCSGGAYVEPPTVSRDGVVRQYRVRAKIKRKYR